MIDDIFKYSGTPILESKRLFCWHDEKGAWRTHIYFSDIKHVQCSKCGWLHYPRNTPNWYWRTK